MLKKIEGLIESLFAPSNHIDQREYYLGCQNIGSINDEQTMLACIEKHSALSVYGPDRVMHQKLLGVAKQRAEETLQIDQSLIDHAEISGATSATPQF